MATVKERGLYSNIRVSFHRTCTLQMHIHTYIHPLYTSFCWGFLPRSCSVQPETIDIPFIQQHAKFIVSIPASVSPAYPDLIIVPHYHGHHKPQPSWMPTQLPPVPAPSCSLLTELISSPHCSELFRDFKHPWNKYQSSVPIKSVLPQTGSLLSSPIPLACLVILKYYTYVMKVYSMIWWYIRTHTCSEYYSPVKYNPLFLPTQLPFGHFLLPLGVFLPSHGKTKPCPSARSNISLPEKTSLTFSCLLPHHHH